MSTVNAANMDSNDADNIVSASDNITITNNNDIVGADNNTDIILSDSSDIGSFKELSDEISKGQDIKLEKDYEFKSDLNSQDATLINGIVIDKSITIDGNGHSINGNGLARIFTITADNVILNNITIKNAFINNTIPYVQTSHNNENITIGNGAGISWLGDNGTLKNSVITGNVIYSNITFWNGSDVNVNYTLGSGAGVYWGGENGIIENTNVFNNTIYYDIVIKYNVYTLNNCNIARMLAVGAGIFINGENVTIRKSNFSENFINGTYNTTNKFGGETNYDFLINEDQQPYSNVSNFINLGASVFWKGENGYVLDSNFYNNVNGTRGAGIYWFGVNGTIESSLFFNNSAVLGGAIYWYGANGTLLNSDFSYNHVSQQGGAIFWQGANGTLLNLNFNNNGADYVGGAIRWNGVNGTLSKSKFYNNSAITDGGAIRMNGHNLIVSNSIFEENVAYREGGAIFDYGINGTIFNSTFVKNIASNYGGAILGGGGTNFTVLSCMFVDNYASNGGAFRSYSRNATVLNSTFINNTANQGGAIMLDLLSGYGIIKFSNFTNNIAYSMGGAVYLSLGVSYNITHSNFINNSATISNDIFVYGNVNDYHFDYNTFKGFYLNLTDKINYNFYNGIVGISATPGQYNLNAIVKIGGSQIGNSVTISSGTIGNTKFELPISSEGQYTIEAVITSTDSTNTYVNYGKFISFLNSAIIYVSPNGTGSGDLKNESTNWVDAINIIADGFTVYLLDGEYTNIINQIITKSNLTIIGSKNTIINGDGKQVFSISGSNVVIENITFKNTYALNGGGAIYMRGNNGKIINSTFINNTAGSQNIGIHLEGYGGAVRWLGSNGVILNSTFINNTVINYYGGAIYWSGDNGNISGCTFTNNTATYQNDIYTTKTLICENNRFNGTYISVLNNVSGFASIEIKITPGQYDVNGTIYVDGKSYKNITIKANTNYNEFTLYDLPLGSHILDVVFFNNTNEYINEYSVNIIIVPFLTSIIYVSPNGVGDGDSINNPTNFQTALTIAQKGSKIILLNGRYTDIVGVPVSLSYITIIGCESSILDAEGLNRMLVISGENVTLRNIRFENGNTTANGGAIHWSSINGNLINCTFVNNTAYNGGALYANSVNITVFNCTFINNNAANDGGAINAYRNMTVNASFFYNNFAGREGGAIFSSADGLLINSTFKENHATSMAGAVTINNMYGEVNIFNCSFIGNSANYAGAFRSYGRNVTISQSIFSNNIAKRGYAGAIAYSLIGGYGIIEYCSFINNTAIGNGGGIYLSVNMAYTISHSNFTNNTAKIMNDIYVSNGISNVVIEYNNFKGFYINLTDKVVANYGNILGISVTPGNYVLNALVQVDDAILDSITVSANSNINTKFDISNLGIAGGDHRFNVTFSSIDGSNTNTYINYMKTVSYVPTINLYVSPDGDDSKSGESISEATSWDYVLFLAQSGYTIILLEGVYTFSSSKTISLSNITIKSLGNVTFDMENNNALLYVNGNYVNLQGITFKNDKSSYGAVYWNGIHGKLIKCTFINNTGSNANKGGGAVYWVGQYGEICNSTFISNFASGRDGGAVYWNGNDGIINNSYFYYNNATREGGSIFILGSRVNISSCVFVGNYAKNLGGAVMIQGSGSVLFNCTFSLNHAVGGGALRSYAKNITVLNSTFSDNYASYGGAVSFDGSQMIVNVENCIFSNNSASSLNSGGGACYFTASGTYNLNNLEFYNNSAIAGSAIWTNKNLEIFNSKFLDNKANTSLMSYEIDSTTHDITVHFEGNNNYLNAIYSSGSLNIINVTYWGVGGEITGDTVSKCVSESGQNITIKIVYKVNGTEVYSSSILTDKNGDVTFVAGLDEGYYYVEISHPDDFYYTGITKDFEMYWGKDIVSLNITILADKFYSNSNIAVLIEFNNTINSTVNYAIVDTTINGTVNITNGVGKFYIDASKLYAGIYTLSVSFNGTSEFYGQENETEFTVLIDSHPNALITIESDNITSLNVNLYASVPFDVSTIHTLLQFFGLRCYFSDVTKKLNSTGTSTNFF